MNLHTLLDKPSAKSNCPYCGSNEFTPFKFPETQSNFKRSMSHYKLSGEYKLIAFIFTLIILVLLLLKNPGNFFGSAGEFIGAFIFCIVIAYFLSSITNNDTSQIPIPPGTIVSRCPCCHSTEYTAGNKGFGYKKAALGGLALGPLGLLAGGIGSKKVEFICLHCGHTWTPNSIEVQLDIQAQEREYRLHHH
jgi:DNA-directed RNA polymerase subunit RPC12/RpoP